MGLDAIGDRCRTLGERLRDDLGQLPGVSTHDLGTHRCAIVTAKVAGRSAGDVAAALGRASINVSTTVAGHNPLDTEERGIHPLVRFSPATPTCAGVSPADRGTVVRSASIGPWRGA